LRLERVGLVARDLEPRVVADLRGDRDHLAIAAPRARQLAELLVAGGDVEQRAQRGVELVAGLEARTRRRVVALVGQRARLVEQLLGGRDRRALRRWRGRIRRLRAGD